MDKIKVLLADDEPFILKGLKVLIDWEEEGCEIVATAENGRKAYEIIADNDIDLAIVDIRMPEMTGLELIERVRKECLGDTQFVILSGYGDFEYAQQALRLNVSDYLLKPVKEKQLKEVIRKTVLEKNSHLIEQENSERLKRACLVQYLVSILSGKSNERQISYVTENMELSGELNFIHIALNGIARLEEMTDEEVMDIKKKVTDNCLEYLGRFNDHLLLEATGFEEEYELAFLYCEEMARSSNTTKEEYLSGLRKAALQGIPVDIVLLSGKTVKEIGRLPHSYSSACALRSFRSLRNDRSIYFYDEDVHVSHTQAKSMIHKYNMDDLVSAIGRHDNEAIDTYLEEFFTNMDTIKFNDKMVNMNMDYLLFRMIHLAVEIDENIEQDNILLNISDDVFVSGKDFKEHLRNFVHEYSDYLEQLRGTKGQGGLIADIERDIKENYSENLTLRDLGKKYFINSSYLGQMFRKKYGMSFKDYLNNYRIEKAAELLSQTDRRVSDIAMEVGYKDTDYFVSKFIEAKGCTPTKFRRSDV